MFLVLFVSAEVSNVVYNLKLNEISQIIETGFGYHVIKLQEINKPIAPNLKRLKTN